MKQLLGCFVAVLLLHTAAAYPVRWVTAHLDPVPTVPAGLSCTSHPEPASWSSLGLTVHGFAGATTIQPSPYISFAVSDPVGSTISPSTGICLAPGTGNGYKYTVQVDVTNALGTPSIGHMFLTTNAGSLQVPTGAAATAQACATGSRIYTTVTNSRFSQELVVSCPSLAGVTSVTVRATFSDGQNSAFQTTSITLPVDATCYTAVCANYTAPPPPPPPSTAPPPPPTTNPPGAKPVYPDCWGAQLLPNPCPIGKRCFYDQECKPQTQDLVYPNCGNAAPLVNPWPNGKCCFYDSQCKPQCEDKTNTKCKALNIPACSVTGCGWCSATNAAVCERCWTGYLLNLQTGKCNCAPGYSGSTLCKQCPAGQISYGGQLPTAGCITCPAGRVANKEQTECVLASAWDHWGYDLTNRRWGYGEKLLNVSNAGQLQPKWTFTAGGDVTATPTIANGRLYVPDWSGNLWCLDAITGSIIWQRTIADLVYSVDPNPYPHTPNKTIISRTSPAVAGNLLVVPVMKKAGGYPYLFALNAADGSIVWGKRVDAHPAAMLTMSPTVHAGYIYQGVSSLEELWATDKNYPCCTFRGNMIKVDLATGEIVWRTYMVPDNGGTIGGFSGNSLWGSSPALDVRRNQVYIASGNNYEAPEEYTACIAALGPITTDNYAQAIQCEEVYGQGNYHNSILALDMTTGAIRWVRQLGGPDAWNGACGMGGNNPNCATTANKTGLLDLNSPDYDFGQAPMLVKACKNGHCKQLVVAGQKSGWLWALNPDTGLVHWSLPVGPGGTVGGLQWGSAADNTRIYVANNNYLSRTADLTTMKSVVNFPTTTNQPAPTATDGGLAAAVDAYTGEILWTFANPTLHWDGTGKHGRSQAPMTVVNDIVFYPSMDADGTLFLLDARTGKMLYSYKTLQTSGCGPSVVDGRVYVGSGYANFGLGLPGDKLHMLSL